MAILFLFLFSNCWFCDQKIPKFHNSAKFCTKRNGGWVLSGVVFHFALIFLGFINRLHVSFECAKYLVISGILENNFSFGLGYSLLIILAMVNVLGKIGLGWSKLGHAVDKILNQSYCVCIVLHVPQRIPLETQNWIELNLLVNFKMLTWVVCKDWKLLRLMTTRYFKRKKML